MQDGAPFCFYCGYNLAGLDLPRPCPECGWTADPQRQIEEARAWFASWRAWFGSLHRPSRLPPGLLYALDDERSRQIARRRVFVALALPAILTLVVVLVAASFVVQRTYKCYYVNPQDPQRIQRLIRQDSTVDRPFHLNLHLLLGPSDFILLASPTKLERCEDLISEQVKLGFPPTLDKWAATCSLTPILVLVFGYGACRLLLVFAVRGAESQRGQRLKRCCVTAASIPAVLGGIGSWLWLAFVVCQAPREFYGSWGSFETFWMSLAAVGVWLIAGIVGTLTCVRLDRCGLVLVPWSWFWCAFMIACVGEPLLAWYLLIRLLG